jgi:hypothetical protein
MFFLMLGINRGKVSAADDIITVQVPLQYGQSEARTMLNMINDFRTGDDAWITIQTIQQRFPAKDLAN